MEWWHAEAQRTRSVVPAEPRLIRPAPPRLRSPGAFVARRSFSEGGMFRPTVGIACKQAPTGRDGLRRALLFAAGGDAGADGVHVMRGDVLAVGRERTGSAAITDRAGRQRAAARGFQFADALEQVFEIGFLDRGRGGRGPSRGCSIVSLFGRLPHRAMPHVGGSGPDRVGFGTVRLEVRAERLGLEVRRRAWCS